MKKKIILTNNNNGMINAKKKYFSRSLYHYIPNVLNAHYNHGILFSILTLRKKNILFVSAL